ncbi:unnamed protein product [Sympodiomycopsis kandeliae]
MPHHLSPRDLEASATTGELAAPAFSLAAEADSASGVNAASKDSCDASESQPWTSPIVNFDSADTTHEHNQSVVNTAFTGPTTAFAGQQQQPPSLQRRSSFGSLGVSSGINGNSSSDSNPFHFSVNNPSLAAAQLNDSGWVPARPVSCPTFSSTILAQSAPPPEEANGWHDSVTTTSSQETSYNSALEMSDSTSYPSFPSILAWSDVDSTSALTSWSGMGTSWISASCPNVTAIPLATPALELMDAVQQLDVSDAINSSFGMQYRQRNLDDERPKCATYGNLKTFGDVNSTSQSREDFLFNFGGYTSSGTANSLPFSQPGSAYSSSLPSYSAASSPESMPAPDSSALLTGCNAFLETTQTNSQRTSSNSSQEWSWPPPVNGSSVCNATGPTSAFELDSRQPIQDQSQSSAQEQSTENRHAADRPNLSPDRNSCTHAVPTDYRNPWNIERGRDRFSLVGVHSKDFAVGFDQQRSPHEQSASQNEGASEHPNDRQPSVIQAMRSATASGYHNSIAQLDHRLFGPGTGKDAAPGTMAVKDAANRFSTHDGAMARTLDRTASQIRRDPPQQRYNPISAHPPNGHWRLAPRQLRNPLHNVKPLRNAVGPSGYQSGVADPQRSPDRYIKNQTLSQGSGTSSTVGSGQRLIQPVPQRAFRGQGLISNAVKMESEAEFSLAAPGRPSPELEVNQVPLFRKNNRPSPPFRPLYGTEPSVVPDGRTQDAPKKSKAHSGSQTRKSSAQDRGADQTTNTLTVAPLASLVATDQESSEDSRFVRAPKRATVACTPCRQTKRRCDMGEPCSACSRRKYQRGGPCEYNHPTPRLKAAKKSTGPKASKRVGKKNAGNQTGITADSVCSTSALNNCIAHSPVRFDRSVYTMHDAIQPHCDSWQRA